MILEHYSGHELEWPPRNYAQTHDKPGWGWPMKPEGLWLSVKGKDDWPNWCMAESFRIDTLAVCTRVHLKPGAKVLPVSGEQELWAFDEKYGVEWSLSEHYTSHRIDWKLVAEDYDGIIIAPYVWECRLPMRAYGPRRAISDWYYGWDCASGCIWNGERAIASFEKIKQEAAA